MKRILASVLLIALAAVTIIGCGNDNIEVEKESKITDFPYVTEDGRVLYQLEIEGHLMDTTNYPFRYTTEALLSGEAEKYDELMGIEKETTSIKDGTKKDKDDSKEESTDKKSAEKSSDEITGKNRVSSIEKNTMEAVMATSSTILNATTKPGTSSTVISPTKANYLNLTETDDYCLYFPVKDVLDYYDIKYVEGVDGETITTEINKKTVYLREGKTTLYHGDEMVKVTAPKVYDGCLYATSNFFKYFLQLESDLSFDKTIASLKKIEEETTTQSVAKKCSVCRGFGEVICPECGGDGVVSQYEILYNEDTNADWTNPAPNDRKCTHCNGLGLITCPQCQGYGVEENPAASTTKETTTNKTETTSGNTK